MNTSSLKPGAIRPGPIELSPELIDHYVAAARQLRARELANWLAALTKAPQRMLARLRSGKAASAGLA